MPETTCVATENRPRFACLQTVIVFVLIFALGVCLVVADSLTYIEKQKQTAIRLASAESSVLTQQLNASVSMAYTLETILRERHFEIDQQGLESFAGQLLKQHPAISSLQYSPDGIVTYVAPMAGNEPIIGHNLFEDPKRNREALAAVETHQLTVAGPFELIQGGVALVARLPIFRTIEQQERFWGFSAVLIRLDDLIGPSTLNRLSLLGYEWALYRSHPETGQPHLFYGTTDSISPDSVNLEIKTPNASWFLTLSANEGWLAGNYLRINLGLLICLIVSSLFAYFVYFIQKQPVLLKQQVDLRTGELQTAQSILEHSEQRLAQVADNSRMWIWEVDAQGLYTYCSDACEYLFGYTAEEIIGKKYFYDFFHPQDREQLKEASFAIMEQREKFKEFPNRNINRLGDSVWLSTNAEPIIDENNVLIGCRGADFDITERKMLMMEQTRSAQLAALGTVAAGVAHEINNPIQGILNYATLIKQAPEKTSQVVDISHRIIYESERIASITKDLLYYSRDHTVNMMDLDIKETIERALSLIETKVKRKGIIIKTSFYEQVPLVRAQPQAIQQIVINLVDNAYDALRIKDLPVHEKIIKLSVDMVEKKASHFVSIEVVDNGMGMNKISLLRAKEAFYSTKPSSQGTGLGLSIVNDIVANHGGEFIIESEENVYTRMQVLLPVTLDETSSAG